MPTYFNKTQDWLNFDRDHLWHPYTSLGDPLPTYPVVGAQGVRLQLAGGKEIIDGMSSWWCAIHGYGHPALHEAAVDQLNKMSHVMFGGIAHEPAAQLGAQLVEMTPDELQYVFLADSGSISVEVAMKMAIQYWFSKGEVHRRYFCSPKGGYHGDPFHCMSVSDPENGMHNMFAPMLPQQLFADRPSVPFDQQWDPSEMDSMRGIVDRYGDQIAAIILEPVMQGTGGMNFYHPSYLQELRQICDNTGILLIHDEIATGFGRTGTLFAAEHADITPDIMCVGKALTGGMLTLAATLTTSKVVDVINGGPNPTLMHGPTFMGNPLACAVASANIDLLMADDWQSNVNRIHAQLQGLVPLQDHPAVADVRTLGAVGVVEMVEPVDVAVLQRQFVERGVWVRPFGRLIYVMPPYVSSNEDLVCLVEAIVAVVRGTDGGQ